MKYICFDIDGVLTEETEGWSKQLYENRTSKVSMIQLVNVINRYPGYEVNLFTARHEEDREITITWLKKHKVNYNKLIMDKPHYHLLIDDKTINPENLSISELIDIILKL